MNSGHTNEAKGKVKEVSGKVSGKKRTDYEGKAEKQGGKTQAKLGELNNGARK